MKIFANNIMMFNQNILIRCNHTIYFIKNVQQKNSNCSLFRNYK